MRITITWVRRRWFTLWLTARAETWVATNEDCTPRQASEIAEAFRALGCHVVVETLADGEAP